MKRKLGRYEIEDSVASGGMGNVYRARDPLLQRQVAIKEVRVDGLSPGELEHYQGRFFREARIAASLQHPNIVFIHDVGVDEGIPWMAMEWVEGQTLQNLLKRKQALTWSEFQPLATQLAAALDFAHRRGIVHRDLKPSNLMVTAEGQLKIVDFGLARIEQSEFSLGDVFLGTPAYSSPEQITGGEIDARSDLFSLAILSFELLTGRWPFPGPSPDRLLFQITQEEPELSALASISGAQGLALWPVFQRALQKEKADRFARASGFLDALAATWNPAGESSLLEPVHSTMPMQLDATWLASLEKIAPSAPSPAAPTEENGRGSSDNQPPAGAYPAREYPAREYPDPPRREKPSALKSLLAYFRKSHRHRGP
jgi:serine/threonine-protein kinase